MFKVRTGIYIFLKKQKSNADLFEWFHIAAKIYIYIPKALRFIVENCFQAFK